MTVEGTERGGTLDDRVLSHSAVGTSPVRMDVCSLVFSGYEDNQEGTGKLGIPLEFVGLLQSVILLPKIKVLKLAIH